MCLKLAMCVELSQACSAVGANKKKTDLRKNSVLLEKVCAQSPFAEKDASALHTCKSLIACIALALLLALCKDRRMNLDEAFPETFMKNVNSMFSLPL